jgi:acyl carrier protein
MGEKRQDVIQEKIKNIIVSIADGKIDITMIESSENGISRLGLNSLNMIKILVEIEKEFDIEIDYEEINPHVWSSLDHLSDYISNLT